MKEALLSVIVPVYNTEKYLSECLNSILAQTYKNLEIVLINDGSTDGSGKICDEYAKQNKSIKVIHQSNKGASAARNIGISNATGMFLSFIDADDFLIDSQVYSLCLKYMNLYQADWVGWNPGHSVKKLLPGLNTGTQYKDVVLYSIADLAIGPSANMQIYKKELFDQNQIRFPVGMQHFEDKAVVLRYALHAKNFYYIQDHKFYYYRKNPSSTTHSYNARSVQNLKMQIEYFKELLESTHLPYNIYLQRWINLQFYHIYSSKIYLNHSMSISEKINKIKKIFPLFSKELQNTRAVSISLHIFIILFFTRHNCFWLAYFVAWVSSRMRDFKHCKYSLWSK